MELRDTACAGDGRELAVTRFPAEGQAWATMVIAGAMAVRQDYYADYARFLARSGVHVLTFDYRGMGASRPDRLAGLEVTVDDWARLDLEAMLEHARAAGPGLPLALTGHSLGGQILGIVPGNAGVAAAINVTAGSGWYRHNVRMALRVRFLWFVAMPLLTPLFGYFPGKALRMVGDLPRGVARQWRRWCLHPDYLLCEGPAARAAFDRVRAPILSWSFEDDSLLARAAIESLNGFYRNARLEHRHLRPEEIGRRRVGHFGFFAEASRGTLWAASLAWLRAAVFPDSMRAAPPTPPRRNT
jgi:predicted alpha/beta hydrolase